MLFYRRQSPKSLKVSFLAIDVFLSVWKQIYFDKICIYFTTSFVFNSYIRAWSRLQAKAWKQVCGHSWFMWKGNVSGGLNKAAENLQTTPSCLKQITSWRQMISSCSESSSPAEGTRNHSYHKESFHGGITNFNAFYWNFGKLKVWIVDYINIHHLLLWYL